MPPGPQTFIYLICTLFSRAGDEVSRRDIRQSKYAGIGFHSPNMVVSHRLNLTRSADVYDEEALVEPVRIVREYHKLSGHDEGEPFAYSHCVQTIFPIEGRAVPRTPGAVFEYEVPDLQDRPWARLWEEYFEQGMSRPEEEDFFSFD